MAQHVEKLSKWTWGIVWLAVMAGDVWLCLMIAGDQPIAMGLFLLAALIASIGLVSMRHCWTSGNRIASIAAATVTTLATMTVIVGAISFWSASIDGVHAQIMRERDGMKAMDAVKSKRREAFSSTHGGKSSAQIEAEMQTALTKPHGTQTLGARTANCTDTASYHYRFCSEFLSLKSQMAAARQAEELERKVWEDSTHVVAAKINRSFFDGAIFMSENFGGTVRGWILAIVVLIVSFLEALRAFALYIGFAPSREDRRRAAEPRPAPKATPGPLSPAVTAPAAAPAAQEKAKAKPNDMTNVVPIATAHSPAFFADESPRKKKGGKAGAPGKKNASVTTWIEECTSMTPDRSTRTSADVAWQSYHAYCVGHGIHPVGRKVLSRLLGKYTRRDPARDRDQYGSLYPSLLVAMPEEIRASRNSA